LVHNRVIREMGGTCYALGMEDRRLAGIDVYMHATFLRLVGFIVVATWAQSHNAMRTLYGVFFVLVIFGCIVFHELRHALTARHYGIRIRDIVLLPIGAVARLERMPEDPNQELLVALAGPAVNVVIASSLFMVLRLVGRFPTLRQAATISWTGRDFLPSLMAVNAWLVLFNRVSGDQRHTSHYLLWPLAENGTPHSTTLSTQPVQLERSEGVFQ
jgi:Zn-dependent protease